MGIAILTGFQPFRDHTINPSQQLAEGLDGYRLGDLRIHGYILPVAFGADTEILFPAIEDLRPDLVLSLGLASGSPCLAVERMAVNLRANGDGKQAPILPEGPAAYFATVDVDAVCRAVTAKCIPALPHVYAGDYLCNHVMYQALHFCATRQLATRVGFIHLPQSTEQAIAESRMAAPSLPLEVMKLGVLTAIEAALADLPSYRQDSQD